ncbi:hypothetical protein BDV98DRAFT_605218 [Pterulicium gracile]|uniref:RRM domain-containing protein n=1 Tax=Pterulicium gracile TaxID=1884261 RepID=A0A5C3QHH0_9AGAR|nr:hypothetical protein BDV98DRAFT_605218 [Pterula gracilis]
MSDAQAATIQTGVATVVAQEPKIDETPGHKVFVGNLAYSVNDDGLKALFEPFKSDILSVQVITHGPKKSSGYGFVSLSTPEAAQKAIDSLHNKEVDGRPLVVQSAKNPEQKEIDRKERRAKRRSGRRGSKAVPGEVTDAEANGDAPKADAAPGTEDANKSKKKKKSSKRKSKRKTEGGEGVATPGEETAAVDATQKKARKPRAERTPRAPGEAPVGELSKTGVFVANLGFSVDEAALQTLFTDAGFKVETARVARMRWGRHPRKSRGFGFVQLTSEEEQKKAITALNGKTIGDREIVVKVAVNREDDEDDKPEDAAAGAAAATPAAAAPAAANPAVPAAAATTPAPAAAAPTAAPAATATPAAAAATAAAPPVSV